MKSASIGQTRTAITDDDSRMQIEDKPEVDKEERAEPPKASSTSIRRKIEVKSEPRAVTTQEAVDGYRERDEDRECRTDRAGQHHGAVNHWSGAQVGKTIQSFLRSVVAQSGWMNMKNHSHCVGCDDKKRRGKRNVQCFDERATENHQRSGWRRMRSCHGAGQKVNNFEKSDCENFAEEKTDEIFRR